MKKQIKNANSKIILILVFGLIIFLIFLRFLLGGPEDTWICQNNSWIKHGNPQEPPPKTGCGGEQIVGGDRDEHGCINSAGYSWCAPKNKCLRVWEEPCK